MRRDAPGKNTLVVRDVTPVVKTYRYLRLAILGMVVLLLFSVGWETLRHGSGCWQTSISSYYYTSVQQVFVATLITVGVCMIVIRGSTSGENLALNVAGIMCPVVALVPTPTIGGCSQVAVRLTSTRATVDNNITALLAAGVVGLAAAITITSAGGARRRPLSLLDLVGLGAAFAVLVGFGSWFIWERSTFFGWAHDAAATMMFLSVIAVVLLNMRDLAWENASARQEPLRRRDYVNRYLAVFLLMVVGVVAVATLWFFVPWNHAVLWLEGVLIVMFAAFWAVQAHELWNRGARAPADLEAMDISPPTGGHGLG